MNTKRISQGIAYLFRSGGQFGPGRIERHRRQRAVVGRYHRDRLQVDRVEYLHFPDLIAARVRQVAVVVVDG